MHHINIIKLAGKNIKRKLFRSVAILLAIMLSSALVFVGFSTLRTVRESMELSLARLGADIMVAPGGNAKGAQKILLAGEPSNFYMPSDVLGIVRGVKGVEAASAQLFLTSSILDCCSMPTVLLIGYDPETDFTLKPWIKQVHNEDIGNYPAITIGSDLVYQTAGSIATFYGKMFKIRDSLYRTGVGFFDYSIFMSMDEARDMIEKSGADAKERLSVSPDDISSILVRVAPGHDFADVARAIQEALPGYSAFTIEGVLTEVRRELEASIFGVVSAGLAAWAMSTVLIAMVFAIAVNERQRELGILRALGATRSRLVGLIVSEAAILSSIGSAAGVAAGWYLLKPFVDLLNKSTGGTAMGAAPESMLAAVGAACVALFLLAGMLASSVPAIRAAMKEPDQAIRMEK